MGADCLDPGHGLGKAVVFDLDDRDQAGLVVEQAGGDGGGGSGSD